MKTILLTVMLAVGAHAVRPESQPIDRLEQHIWLQRFVGNWTLTHEFRPAPGSEPIRFTSTESVRAIGGLWVAMEEARELDDGPSTMLTTLGYDSKAEMFVAARVNSHSSEMSLSRGARSESKSVLTVESQGPSLTDPAKTTSYRERHQFVTRNRRTITLSELQPDGDWIVRVKSEARRDK